MGGLKPLDWPQQAIQLDGNGCALILLTLPAATPRFAASHTARQALRQILGELLAHEIILRETAFGPMLDCAARDIRLSLSYAANLCLIGLAERHALGVDIVRIEPLPEIEALSRLYLPHTACRAVLDTPPATRDASFALHWAQMEARSKCLGLPLAEINPQREQALNTCQLIRCVQRNAYRIALATLPLSSEHVCLSI